MDLQAQLYQAQSAVQLRKEGVLDVGEKGVRKGGVNVSSIMGKKNAGVEERDRQDRLHVKVGVAQLACSLCDACSWTYWSVIATCALYLALCSDRRHALSNSDLIALGWLQSTAAREAECYAALERKAALYEKLCECAE